MTLALEGTLVLYQTIQSLQSREKVIRELRQELEALQGVLQTLWGSTDNLDVDLASLEQPLTRCKNACGDFNAHFTGRQARLGAPSSTRASCDLSSPVLILLNAENPPKWMGISQSSPVHVHKKDARKINVRSRYPISSYAIKFEGYNTRLSHSLPTLSQYRSIYARR